jgi:hypothetical protein
LPINETEEQTAALLDALGIEWVYEPTRFRIQRRGAEKMAWFQPDFYLPEFDVYIEVTQNAWSVGKKPGNIKAVGEQHGVKVLLVTGALLVRYSFTPRVLRTRIKNASREGQHLKRLALLQAVA